MAGLLDWRNGSNNIYSSLDDDSIDTLQERNEAMNKDTSGSAFPVPTANYHTETGTVHSDSYGMTLRQWYAGMAMSGLLANSDYAMSFDVSENGLNRVSSHAHKMADPMLLEGSK